MKFISFTTAVRTMVVFLLLVLVFHLLVLLQIIPFTIVWAGRMKTVEEMWVFESVSIVLNLMLLLAILRKGNYIKNGSWKIANILLWIFAGIFILNTIGNLFAKAPFERWVFTPLTFISAVLCYRIAIERK